MKKNIIGDINVVGEILKDGTPITGVGGEVISQIEYIEDGGDIIGWKFPKYILPLRYVSDFKDYTLYFDYTYPNRKVTAYNNSTGQKIADIATIQFMNSQIIMRGINDDEDDWIDGTTGVDTLEYMLINGSGDYDPGINSYDLYHSGGGGGSSFNIIDQLDVSWDEDDGGAKILRIEFPKNILPLTIRDTQYYSNYNRLFFCYDKGMIVDEEGVRKGGITNSGGCIVAEISGYSNIINDDADRYHIDYMVHSTKNTTGTGSMAHNRINAFKMYKPFFLSLGGSGIWGADVNISSYSEHQNATFTLTMPVGLLVEEIKYTYTLLGQSGTRTATIKRNTDGTYTVDGGATDIATQNWTYQATKSTNQFIITYKRTGSLNFPTAYPTLVYARFSSYAGDYRP